MICISYFRMCVAREVHRFVTPSIEGSGMHYPKRRDNSRIPRSRTDLLYSIWLRSECSSTALYPAARKSPGLSSPRPSSRYHKPDTLDSHLLPAAIIIAECHRCFATGFVMKLRNHETGSMGCLFSCFIYSDISPLTKKQCGFLAVNVSFLKLILFGSILVLRVL